MNVLHLKYVVETARAGSINKAAENLYMGQPNLSRAIKELETELGIEIFERSAKGMVPTPEGERFLQYAKKILDQIDEVEALYKNGVPTRKRFSISAPRASYISEAFAKFSKCIEENDRVELFYKETNAMRSIKNVSDGDYKLAIVRYAESHDKRFRDMFDEKGFAFELVSEFSYGLLMSKKHDLAAKADVRFDDLLPYIEINHADPYVPSMPFSAVRKEELPDNVERRIFVFERASRFDILSVNERTYAWASPVPQKTLDMYGLIQKSCRDNTRVYKDVLIYRKDYKLTELDEKFITELTRSKRLYRL